MNGPICWRCGARNRRQTTDAPDRDASQERDRATIKELRELVRILDAQVALLEAQRDEALRVLNGDVAYRPLLARGRDDSAD